MVFVPVLVLNILKVPVSKPVLLDLVPVSGPWIVVYAF